MLIRVRLTINEYLSLLPEDANAPLLKILVMFPVFPGTPFLPCSCSLHMLDLSRFISWHIMVSESVMK